MRKYWETSSGAMGFSGVFFKNLICSQKFEAMEKTSVKQSLFSHAHKRIDGYEIHTHSGSVITVNFSNEGDLKKEGKTLKVLDPNRTYITQYQHKHDDLIKGELGFVEDGKTYKLDPTKLYV